MRAGLIPGYNTDLLSVEAGMRELVQCGYPATEGERHMVIHYALLRWARGEEEQALRAAIDQKFHGIDLTCWTRVLAAAMAGAQTKEPK
jgi:hypothetical protein